MVNLICSIYFVFSIYDHSTRFSLSLTFDDHKYYIEFRNHQIKDIVHYRPLSIGILTKEGNNLYFQDTVFGFKFKGRIDGDILSEDINFIDLKSEIGFIDNLQLKYLYQDSDMTDEYQFLPYDLNDNKKLLQNFDSLTKNASSLKGIEFGKYLLIDSVYLEDYIYFPSFTLELLPNFTYKITMLGGSVGEGRFEIQDKKLILIDDNYNSKLELWLMDSNKLFIYNLPFIFGTDIDRRVLEKIPD